MAKSTINDGESGFSVRTKLNNMHTELYDKTTMLDDETTVLQDEVVELYDKTTGENIKIAYEAELNTNAYTDTEKVDAATAIAHTELLANPHGVTKAQVGLSLADNTSDADKPVSIAAAEAISVLTEGLDGHTGNVSNPHNILATQITDFDTEVGTHTDVAANTVKLEGIEPGSEVNNMPDEAVVDLTDGGDSVAHYHSSDRDRTNHTGTQLAATISNFDSTVRRGQFNSAGMTTEPSVVDNEDGSITIGSGTVHLFSVALFQSDLVEYTLTGNTFTLVDETTNYIVATYNNGVPVYASIADVSLIDECLVVPVFTVFRLGTSLRILGWDEIASGLPNKLHARLVKTDRFALEGEGLGVTEKNTRELNISAATVWVGARSVDLTICDTFTDPTSLLCHVAGSWTPTSTTKYNNSQYDNGTDLQTLTTGRYAVNWIYREVANSARVGIILGTGNYKLNEAIKASPIKISELPFGLSTQGMLVAKVIVLKGSNTAYLIEPRIDSSSGLTTATTVAKAVPIQDDADYFDGGNVEDALQEIGETRNQNGFDLQDASSKGEVTWNNTTKTMSIAVAAGEASYHYWVDGKKIIQTETITSTVVPSTTDTYYYYLDDVGAMQIIEESAITLAVFYKYAIVGLVYWNQTLSLGVPYKEQHGYRMDSADHEMEHMTIGARFANGFALTGLVDAQDTFTGSASGKYYDEDIVHYLDAEATMPFLYRLGSGSGEWIWSSADNFVGYKDGGTKTVWNEDTGTVHQLTKADSAHDYIIHFVVAMSTFTGYSNFAKIIDQNGYRSRTIARLAIDGAKKQLILDGLPSPEFCFLGAYICRANGDLEELADGSTYLDLRGTSARGSGGDSVASNIAADISVTTIAFDGKLSSTDTDVQKAFNTLDDHAHTATEVGLGNVTNEAQIPLSQKGSANGVAETDSSNIILTAHLPSYVDDVLEYADYASLPATGESGKIYVTIDYNKTFRWSGTVYVEISASLALGTTPDTAYRGDRGKVAYDHSQVSHAPSGAEENVQSDWDATTGDALILNKPTTITTGQASAITANTEKITYPTTASDKLATIESSATADQTGTEIVTAVNTELGSTDWQSGGGSSSGATEEFVISMAIALG